MYNLQLAGFILVTVEEKKYTDHSFIKIYFVNENVMVFKDSCVTGISNVDYDTEVRALFISNH